MQFIDGYTLSVLRDKLKIGDKKVNIRVEVDKFDYIPGQITDFSMLAFETDRTVPSINLKPATVTVPVKTTITFPLSGKTLADYEPIPSGNSFGAPRTGHIHAGIDFGVPIGTGVKAAYSGIVTTAAYSHNPMGASESAGNYIEILHDNGFMTRYLHLDHIAVLNGKTVAVNTKVNAGDIIAYSGDTGNALSPHLHFEIRENAAKSNRGTALDPYPYLKGTKFIREVGTIVEIPNTETNLPKIKAPVYYGLIVEHVYKSNFVLTNGYTGFVHTPPTAWKVMEVDDEVVFGCTPAANGSYMVKKTFTINNSGMMSIKLKTVLSGGNKLEIILDSDTIATVTSDTDDYETTSVEFNKGTHTLYLKTTKSAAGDCKVYVSKVDIVNRYQKLDDDIIQYNDYIEKVVVNSTLQGSQYVKSQPDNGSSNIKQLTVNEEYEFVGVVRTKTATWYKILTGGQEGYISSKNAKLDYDDNVITKIIEVPTGSFAFSKTLVVPNVISVDMDYKYETRSATASFTIANEYGFYTPDYDPTKFSEYSNKFSEYKDVFVENAPVRIYIGYGNSIVRKFTGRISSPIAIDSNGATMTIQCSDMIKILNDCFAYNSISYPRDIEGGYFAWVASDVIKDLIIQAGMDNWRIIEEDLINPSYIIEDSYYTDVDYKEDTYMKITEEGKIDEVELKSIPEGVGFRNPAIWNGVVQAGANYGEYIENICTQLGYWHRCNYYGTYIATTAPNLFDMYGNIAVEPSYKFVDGENIININKSYDFSKIRNHIIVYGSDGPDSFFDISLWKLSQGVRKTSQVYVDYADSYSKKASVAKKLFFDMKTAFRTLQVVVEGNPYIELMDVIEIINRDTNTKDNFVVKGIKDTYSIDGGYLTTLDLFWLQ